MTLFNGGFHPQNIFSFKLWCHFRIVWPLLLLGTAFQVSVYFRRFFMNFPANLYISPENFRKINFFIFKNFQKSLRLQSKSTVKKTNGAVTLRLSLTVFNRSLILKASFYSNFDAIFEFFLLFLRFFYVLVPFSLIFYEISYEPLHLLSHQKNYLKNQNLCSKSVVKKRKMQSGLRYLQPFWRY